MGRLNLGRRFLGLRPFSYTKVGLAELVNKPEAEFEVVNCWCAAIAAGPADSHESQVSAKSGSLPAAAFGRSDGWQCVQRTSRSPSKFRFQRRLRQ